VSAPRACAGLIAAALITIGALSGSVPRADAGPSPDRKTTTIAPGLTLTKIQRKHPQNRIRVLTLTPSSRLTVDVALANDTIPGHEQTTSMARRHDAIAAINGDFTLLPLSPGEGRPVGTFAEDGNLVTSPQIWGRNFSISRDEQTTYFGHARLHIDMLELDVGKTWRIKRWNDWTYDSDEGSLSAYTTAGGQLFRPLADACSVRLFPTGTVTWGSDGAGVTRGYTVDEVKCSEKRLARHGGIVLSTPRSTKQATRMQESLFPSEAVTITWSMSWPGVLDTIGGNPDVVEDGRLAAGECSGSYFCLRNPRTGVGVTEDGKVLFVTVDGRQKKSKGMTLDEFGRLFQSLGATWALNLDGGGSTTMVVRGDIVNFPSGGYERAVGSALLILPGADEAEPEPGPYQTPTPVPSLPSPLPTTPPIDPSWVVPEGERTQSPGCEALLDPGSTGGMLDALARGDLTGSHVKLPHSLRAALETFRAASGCTAQRFLD
jgi:hypothetical protein